MGRGFGAGSIGQMPRSSGFRRCGPAPRTCRGGFARRRVGTRTSHRLVVANAYFPNGNGKERDNSRVPFKLRFYRTLFEQLEKLRAEGAHVLVMGDFNTAHEEIDLARPRPNRNTSGFLARERRELSRWLSAGWVDTFRAFEPGPGHYSWWSQRQGVRDRNIGWRIDYVLAAPEAMRFVRGAFIQHRVRGSDHAPIGVDVTGGIFG
jgi:exodeoxyribonuclease-3